MMKHFFNKEVLSERVYESPLREAYRHFRYVVNRIADVLFYNHLARIEQYFNEHHLITFDDIDFKE